MIGRAIIAVLVALCLTGPALAVQPDEMLADPVLEARAQALDHELRCVKCRSENIASSNADWARDARILVRELISEGKSDADVIAFFRERYGDYVLMTPDTSGMNLALWLAGPALLIVAGGVAWGYLRQRGRAEPAGAGLTEAEQARLDELLRD